jgi:8-oxo-dGTP pyrophosphatase MutT (NUDIX family)
MRSFRTVLEQKIWERRQTLEGFAEYAEAYAREHSEVGTLGVRHLQRLVAGRRSDGRPLGPVRPETARLLERIFRLSIDELLAAPKSKEGASTNKVAETSNDSIDNRNLAASAFRVAVAVVVRDSETLIVCRRGADGGGITWQFPAGIVKPNMLATTIAVRETFAETAIHCTPTRPLGARVHPVTKVYCEYILCEYLTGYARNVDSIENVSVVWAEKSELTRFIPETQIYRPVFDALGLANNSIHN